MRKVTMLALLAVAAPVMAVSQPAEAFKRDPFVAPEGGLDHAKGQRIWNDRMRGACQGKSSMCGDPYAYRYIQRAWYPDNTSRYWVPASDMRYRYRYTFSGPKYRYYPAWGFNREKGAEDVVVDRHGHPVKYSHPLK